MTDEKTVEREFGALEKIGDNYPKILLTTDSFTQNRSGVKHLNVFNWLLELQ
jgi:predicted AAA+ superfamily ATPase